MGRDLFPMAVVSVILLGLMLGSISIERMPKPPSIVLANHLSDRLISTELRSIQNRQDIEAIQQHLKLIDAETQK